MRKSIERFNSRKLNRILSPYLLLIPAFVIYTFIMVIPMVENIRISFTNWDGISQTGGRYIGLRNYILILRDPRLYVSMWVTFRMSFFIIILQQAMGLVLALILEKNTKSNVFFRSLLFIPNLLNTVVVGLIFSYSLSMNFGIINPFFEAIGMVRLAGIDWLGDTSVSYWSVIFATVWMYAGLNMVIYLGSLMNIPLELYESASIDGASPWQKFTNVTFPMIAPALTINTLITLIGCLRLFDLPYIMTGGQRGATETLAILLYNDAFVSRTAGRGAADAVILLILITVLSVLQNSYFTSKEVNL